MDGNAWTKPEGTIEKVSCPKCDAGKYSTGGAMACTDCTGGSIAATAGLSECTKCLAVSVSAKIDLLALRSF